MISELENRASVMAPQKWTYLTKFSRNKSTILVSRTPNTLSFSVNLEVNLVRIYLKIDPHDARKTFQN